MSSYTIEITTQFVNTGFVVVGAGLSRGQWETPEQMPPLNQYISPAVNEALAPVYTTGDGTKGFLRLYPRLSSQSTIPTSIPDADTLYIGWDISEAGVAEYTLTAPNPYKLSASSEPPNGPLQFTVVGAYGPDTCQDGYVWREAFAGDHVCVLPETRQQAAIDNERASSRVDPNGAFGSKSCIAGYVWREARPGDDVCVSEATRQQVIADNAVALGRRL